MPSTDVPPLDKHQIEVDPLWAGIAGSQLGGRRATHDSNVFTCTHVHTPQSTSASDLTPFAANGQSGDK